MTLRIHGLLPRTHANGPGVRYGIWLQGCNLHCPGCFNPDTHDPTAGFEMDVEELLQSIGRLAPPPQGITVSGGEPFLQAANLFVFLSGYRDLAPEGTIILFSGFTLAEIQMMPLGPPLLSLIDLLVAGRFEADRPGVAPLCGSANQSLHFQTDRIRLEDLADLPDLEVLIDRDGTVRVSGIAANSSQD